MLLLRGIYYVDRTQLGLQKTLFAQAEWLTIFYGKINSVVPSQGPD